MPGGIITDRSNAIDYAHASKLTASVVIICIVAGSAGLLFGYDVGVSGGVTILAPFLEKFFPFVFQKMAEADANHNQYCPFNSQAITSFTSSLYIAGLVSSLVAGRVTHLTGRKGCLIIGGSIFLIGTAMNGFALNVWMLVGGRLLLGLGVGLTNVAAPLYLSEMAPPKWRGTLGTGFQLFLTLGVIMASCINFVVSRLGDYGWHVSLGAASIPALTVTIGAFFIPDTPSSLIQRGKVDEARYSLERVRRLDSGIESELNELIRRQEAVKAHKNPYLLIMQRRYRPQLVLTVAIPSFQQLTGINMIALYAPVFFRSVGFGSDGASVGSIILGAVNILSTLVATYAVDRVGRRLLLLQAGAQIFLSQLAMAFLLAVESGTDGTAPFSGKAAIVVMILTCSITAAFAWSWGPLTWLIPSEILPMEVRPAGQGISTACNFIVTFIMSQTFLTVLCDFKYGVFLFYAMWVMIMTTFVALFVPETKGIPLESMDRIWLKHWFWRRFFVEEIASSSRK